MMNKNIHALARAVIISQNHILLCKHLKSEPYFYYLPGGHIEHKESARDALFRELKEEIGVEATIGRFLGCLEYAFESHSSSCHTHEYNFLFETACEALNNSHILINAAEEGMALEWIDMKDLTHIDFRPEPLKLLISNWKSIDSEIAFKSVMENS